MLRLAGKAELVQHVLGRHQTNRYRGFETLRKLQIHAEDIKPARALPHKVLQPADVLEIAF
jgi:hypothetical protein